MSNTTPDELIAALEKIASEREGLGTEERILAAFDALAAECATSRYQLMHRAFILLRRETTAWRCQTGGGMRLVEEGAP